MKKENLQIVKRGLIIVDIVNGFVKEGALADPNIAKIIDENIRLSKMFIDNNEPIIAFRDCHTNESLELKHMPRHCIEGTDEVEFGKGIKELEDNFIVINKNSTSGFVVDLFMEYINNMKNLTEIVITGCCTDICVMNLAIPLKNFFNQVNRDVDVIVPMNAVDTYDIPDVHDKDEWNKMAFRFMEQAGIKVIKKY